jgi:hypothetical protein
VGDIVNENRIRRLEKRAKLVLASQGLLWLDRETAAAYIGIGKTSLNELGPVLKPSKLGRRTIYNREKLDDYLKRCAPDLQTSSNVHSKM